MHQLTLEGAHAAGEAGMHAAAANADRVIREWTARAYAALCAAVRKRPATAEFIVEELRAEITDVPEPDDLRAWGQVTQMAIRRNVITATGTFKRAISSDASPKPCYRRGNEA